MVVNLKNFLYTHVRNTYFKLSASERKRKNFHFYFSALVCIMFLKYKLEKGNVLSTLHINKIYVFSAVVKIRCIFTASSKI